MYPITDGWLPFPKKGLCDRCMRRVIAGSRVSARSAWKLNAKVALQPSWSLLINVEHENANNGQAVYYCPPKSPSPYRQGTMAKPTRSTTMKDPTRKAPWRTPQKKTMTGEDVPDPLSRRVFFCRHSLFGHAAQDHARHRPACHSAGNLVDSDRELRHESRDVGPHWTVVWAGNTQCCCGRNSSPSGSASPPPGVGRRLRGRLTLRVVRVSLEACLHGAGFHEDPAACP